MPRTHHYNQALFAAPLTFVVSVAALCVYLIIANGCVYVCITFHLCCEIRLVLLCAVLRVHTHMFDLSTVRV